MNSITDTLKFFLRLPTRVQRDEIRLVCYKGLSRRKFDNFPLVILQSSTVAAEILKDVVIEPLKGLHEAVYSICRLHLTQALVDIFDGLMVGGRSFLHLVTIGSAVALGILFPDYVYMNLKALNEEGPDDSSDQSNTEVETTKVEEGAQ
jgi:hypothetical protein